MGLQNSTKKDDDWINKRWPTPVDILGYVRDIVMHIISTEKRYVLWYLVWICNQNWYVHNVWLIFPGYICDIVVYITSTEKMCVLWCLVWICDKNWYVHTVCFFTLWWSFHHGQVWCMRQNVDVFKGFSTMQYSAVVFYPKIVKLCQV